MIIIKKIMYFSFSFFYIAAKWIKIRFTKVGLLAVAGLLASAIIGIDTKKTVAYQAFTFLLALICISIAFGMISRIRCIASRKLPRFGTADHKLDYSITICNKTAKSQKFLYIIDNPENFLPTFKEFLQMPKIDNNSHNFFDRIVGYHRWKQLVSHKKKAKVKKQIVPVILPDSKSTMRVSIIPLKRGHLKLKGFSITRSDPFGLFNSFKTISFAQSILILPKLYKIPYIDLLGTRKYQPGGVALSSSVGESEEFLSLRDYRPEDPLRRIHWKSWAKTGKPIVKEYQEKFFVRHALILDTFQKSEHSIIFEEAVSVAASFVLSVQSTEALLDFMFVGPKAYCFTSGRGVGTASNIIKILACVKPCINKPFSELHPVVDERSSLISSCMCILLTIDDDRIKLITMLQSLQIHVMVFIITDQNTNIPKNNMEKLKGKVDTLHILKTGKIEQGLTKI